MPVEEITKNFVPCWAFFYNPPNYVDIQASHPDGHLRDDLRPSDVGWEIHKDFYQNIRAYLKPGSRMYISEVCPYALSVHFKDALYDLRERLPIDDFYTMIHNGGLTLQQVVRYDPLLWMLEITTG